jgi:hypothetical protein
MDESRATSGPLEPERTVVVYDARSGQVLRVHHFSAMPGAELPPSAELRHAALLDAARRHGRDPSEMAVIDVERGELRRGVTYRVSEAGHKLEEQD